MNKQASLMIPPNTNIDAIFKMFFDQAVDLFAKGVRWDILSSFSDEGIYYTQLANDGRLVHLRITQTVQNWFFHLSDADEKDLAQFRLPWTFFYQLTDLKLARILGTRFDVALNSLADAPEVAEESMSARVAARYLGY